MEDEILKRNTDCVYFLASPFTCKKGVECEYRHSEMARLNPRDCWYWISGNCLNPTCAFRHPPLEIHNEASMEAAPPLLSQPSAPAKKTTVPCYYYLNGFCNKGDRCPFLHEPGDSFCLKPKAINAGADAPIPSLDSKKSGRPDTRPVSVSAEKQLTLSEMATKTSNGFQGQQRQQVPQSTAIAPEPITREQYIPPHTEAEAVKTVSLQPAEASFKSVSEPSLDSDQISEELIDGNIVRDEWLESSPGFDVLVDGKTEGIVYEDDPEYLTSLAGNDRDCENLYMPHDFAHQTEYDDRRFFDNGLYESSEHFEDELRTNFREYSSKRTQDRKARRVMASKRSFLCMESPVHHDMDLRDYLRKRRMVDGYLETQDFVHQVRDVRQEKLQRPASRQSRGRIASKVERNGARLPRRRRSVTVAERGRPRFSQHDGSEQCNGVKVRQTLTEQRSYSKRERDAQDSTTFHGPKSLAEIKETRKVGHANKIATTDFEGPKPLCEILKDKKRTFSSCDSFVSGSN